MNSFVYTGMPARVIFGSGTISSLPDEISRLGLSQVLILTTPSQSTAGLALQHRLGSIGTTLFTDATMHTPVEVTERALSIFHEIGADGIIAIGGGSTVGLSKALALRTDASQIVIPTTYAGSEMTSILGETIDGKKVTQKSLKVLPETVIYDVDHTLTLPVNLTVSSGINALAHAIEALYAEEANPVLSLLAEEGISRLTAALPIILDRPNDLSARTDALHGAWLCAICLGSGGVALHHKLCHVLGGSFDLPHAETHTVVLPHAIAYNAQSIPAAIEVLKRTVCLDDPIARLFDIAKQAGVPTSLRELGMQETGIDIAVKQALENPYYNPRKLEAAGLRGLIYAAWAGARPILN